MKEAIPHNSRTKIPASRLNSILASAIRGKSPQRAAHTPRKRMGGMSQPTSRLVSTETPLTESPCTSCTGRVARAAKVEGSKKLPALAQKRRAREGESAQRRLHSPASSTPAVAQKES